jgi:hypothetical protein
MLMRLLFNSDLAFSLGHENLANDVVIAFTSEGSFFCIHLFSLYKWLLDGHPLSL